MNHRLKVIAMAVILSAVVARAALAATVEGSFERSLRVNGPADLSVDTGSGTITVRPGADATVRIIGRIRAQDGWFSDDAEKRVRRIEANPPIEQNGNTIRIRAIENRGWRSKVSISYEILTPRNTRLRSQTGSGNQTIDDLRGPVEAATGAGSLTIGNIGDGVTATTGSGSIDVSNVQGSVRATTGSGGIRAVGIAGGITATTGSGSIRAELTASGAAAAMTGSGRIEIGGLRGALRVRSGSGGVAVSGEPIKPWRVDVASGSIVLHIPKGAAFDLRARTVSGRISTGHALTAQGTLRRNELSGKVRGGGPLVALSTRSGSIRVD